MEKSSLGAEKKSLALRAMHIPGQLILEASFEAWRREAMSIQIDRGSSRQRQPSSPFDSLFLLHRFWVTCFGSCVAIGPIKCLPAPSSSHNSLGRQRVSLVVERLKSIFWIQKPSVLECKNGPNICVSGAELPGWFSACIYSRMFCMHFSSLSYT